VGLIELSGQYLFYEGVGWICDPRYVRESTDALVDLKNTCHYQKLFGLRV